jgi:pyruvate dehydrogenase E2 component (dihydrolipoamide acetyltransferase)
VNERVFPMPDLGEGLEEGKIVAWLVATGDEVALNQPLVEVETAKAAVEIPSPFAGRIVALHGDADDDVPVGAPLVTFEVEGMAETTGGQPPGAVTSRVEYPTSVERPSPAPGVRATPPVRKLAKELGVELEVIDGTGPGGRVTEHDVRRAADLGKEPSSGSEDLRIERVPVVPTRRVIAQRLSEQAAIPQVTTFRTVDCRALTDLRRELGVSPLPVVLAALCRTIASHPLLNARWADDRIELRGTVNVGIAADTERGLVVPVLRDAGDRGIADLAQEVRHLAEAARAGTLAVRDLSATATIAVSNTGSYGSEAGTPILSPGTSATMAFGVIAERAVVVDGSLAIRPTATISLTFDHRVLDGAVAGRALTDLVALLESAERLGELPR